MLNEDMEFRAPAAGGEIVGWHRSGPEDAPPALLLHGGPGLSEYLETLADELDGLFPIARFQQRGLAPSVTDGAKDVEAHMADVIAVLDALSWQKAVVIGHSWGGHLAMHIGIAHPERVNSLVILDPLGAVADGGEAQMAANLRGSLSPGDTKRLDEIEALENPTESDLLEHLGTLWPHYFGDPDRAGRMPPLRFDLSNDQTWPSIHDHLANGTLERGLPSLRLPFVLIHGERSPIPLAESQRTVALVPGGKLVVQSGGGHWAWLEEPGFVRAEIERFLATT